MIVSFLLALTLPSLHPAPEKPSKLVVVSWDGGADWVVDRLLAEKKLPNLQQLLDRGTCAEATVPPFPSKTAVSHYSIFSATWPNRSGVSGNFSPLLPRSDHTIDEGQSGFAAAQHQTEPLWVTIAKTGKKVLALSAAGSAGPEPDLARIKAGGGDPKNYVQFSGFESNFAPTRVIDIAKMAGATTKELKVGDSVIHLRQMKGQIEIEGEGSDGKRFVQSLRAEEPTNKLGRWAGPFRVRRGDLAGNQWFRLFSLDSDSGKSVLYASPVAGFRGTEPLAEDVKYLDAYGAFHDDPFRVYSAGQLGKPVYDGGDGQAERRVIEIIRMDNSLLKRSFRYGWQRYRPDLLFHYSPQTDSAGHTWMGLLDPSCPSYKPAIAAKLWPFYEEVFRLQDDWLGDMMRVAGPETAFALVSDHGMAGVNKFVAINRVLKEAGLVRTLADGSIDYAKSPVCAPPWSDFALVVNSTDRKVGFVPAWQKPAVLDRAAKALLALRDPETGLQVITKVWTATEVSDVGGGGQAGGDLYLDFADGYYPSTRINDPVIAVVGGAKAEGVHGFYPRRRTMQGIFYVGGRGIGHRRLPIVNTIDIVPTLCRLMGWPAPKDAQGRAFDNK